MMLRLRYLTWKLRALIWVLRWLRAADYRSLLVPISRRAIPSRPAAIRVLQRVIAANLQPRCGGLSGSLAPTTFVQVYAISAAWIVGGNWLIAVNSDDTTLRFEPLWPAQLVKRSATWTLEAVQTCCLQAPQGKNRSFGRETVQDPAHIPRLGVVGRTGCKRC